MKKYFIVVGVCVLAYISFNVSLKHSNSNPTGLTITLNNVEALAQTEDPQVSCLHNGSLDCPRTTIKVKYILAL